MFPDRLPPDAPGQNAAQFPMASTEFLRSLIRIILPGLLVATVVALFYALRKPAGVALCLLTLAGILAALVLLQRNRVRPAGYVLLAGLSIPALILASFSGSIASPGMAFLFGIVVFTAWMLGKRAALIASGLLVLFVLVTGALILAGHPLPSYFPLRPLPLMAIEIMLVAVAVFPLVRLLESLRAADERLAAAVAELELQHRLAQSREMGAIGRLARGTAHDMNNVLQAILATAELAAMTRADKVMQQRLDRIVEAAENGAAITRQMLLLGRGHFVQPVPTSLAESVQGMQRMLHHLVRPEVELDFQIESSRTVMIDPGQFVQLLANLLVNAQDATPDGGCVTVRLSDAECGAGRCVELRVQDSGSGVSAEARSRIFEPSFTAEPEEKGAELGQSTVFAVVQSASGMIEVQSEPGRGTAFIVRLPALEPAVSKEA